MKRKSGFTLVELMAVIAVIGILLSIVSVAASATIKSSRQKRLDTMKTALTQAIAAYYAQEGKWPQAIESQANSATTDSITFSDSASDDILREVVGKGFGKGGGKKSMLIDPSGLFVCRSDRVHGKNPRGVEFTEACQRGSKHYMSFSQMVFGYADPGSGRFVRWKVKYDTRTDAVSVEK